MLGIYLLAVFAPRVKQPAALAGFVLGVTVLSAVAMGTGLYWPYYAAVGAVMTWAAGWAVQRLLMGPK